MNDIKILLVEDHLLVREGFYNLIEKETDMKIVGETSKGETAIQLAETLKPDVVLMDISIEGLNGIEATRKIKESDPSIAVLVLSAFDNKEFVLAALEAKASGYLLKNIQGTELLRSIRIVNKGESILHPSVTKTVLNYLQTNKKQTPPKRNQLTDRELQIIRLGAKGMVNKEIAYELSISYRTIQSHWRNIFVKLGASSRIEVILFCVKNQLIDLNEENI